MVRKVWRMKWKVYRFSSERVHIRWGWPEPRDMLFMTARRFWKAQTEEANSCHLSLLGTLLFWIRVNIPEVPRIHAMPSTSRGIVRLPAQRGPWGLSLCVPRWQKNRTEHSLINVLLWHQPKIAPDFWGKCSFLLPQKMLDKSFSEFHSSQWNSDLGTLIPPRHSHQLRKPHSLMHLKLEGADCRMGSSTAERSCRILCLQ